ncbi:hypothetical protein [Thermococcus sp.]|uniref:hypothetical protein n=1 Tax=Thermococcus sp. TaxID=35749 RepID=UPI00262D1186|nr:hypothetical protein [Thermococcus sp.]
MKLFFSLFEKKNDDEDEKKPKPRKSRRKAAAGIALILLFAMSLYAQPASAFGFGSITSKISSVTDKVKNTLAGLSGGALVGATIGAVLGSVIPGAGTIAGAEAGAIIGGAIGAWLGFRHSSSGSGSGGGDALDYRAAQNATTADLEDDKDVVDNTAKALDDTQQAAYKQIAELNAVLRSDLTKYDISETGATGDLWAEVHAPQKAYGFSAFPVQIKLYTKESNIPFSYVHIRSIKVYIKEENSSTPLWTRTWDYGTAGSEGLNGQSVVYSTILKVPDPYAYQIKQMIDSGQVDKNLIMKLFNNASTKAWEIFVDIDAYREEWQNDPQYTDQSSCEAQPNHKWDANTSTCYVKIGDKDISYHVQTTSAWKHVTMSSDIALLTQGMYASLPIRFAKTSLASKWTLYQEKFVGAVSNFITLTYASPVHVMGSTADYKFYIAPNPGYFSPLNVTMTDDFRFFTVRVRDGGSWELADSVFGHLGNLTETGVPKDLNAYYTEGTDVLTYETFGIAYFTIKRGDGQEIPIWEIVWPKVSVQPDERIVMDDTQIQQLATIVNQSVLTADDLSQLKTSVQSLINGLNEKIRTAEALEGQAKGVGNEQAESYAKKAEVAYQHAVDALNYAASSDNKQVILNYLNAAKKYEQAGDFYMSAAKKALYGAPEQAKLDAQMGDKLSDLASQYEPHIDVLGSAKNALSKKVMGIPLWILLVIIFALAGAFVIWKKLL